MTTNSPNPVDGDVQAHQMPAMTDSERQKNIDAIYTRMRSIAEEGDENLQFEYGILRFALVALTSAPAQLLRPVELPDLKECPQEHLGSQLWNEINVWNKAVNACAEALRQQGYGVKS